MLTGGQVADCTAGAQLLERLPACRILHGDKGYDSDAIRRQVEENGTMPNIPPKARWKTCFSPALYRGRNAIEPSAASPHVTIGPISSPPSASLPRSATGYES